MNLTQWHRHSFLNRLQSLLLIGFMAGFLATNRAKARQHFFDEWALMTFYERFEQVVALALGGVYWLLRERDDQLVGRAANFGPTE